LFHAFYIRTSPLCFRFPNFYILYIHKIKIRNDSIDSVAQSSLETFSIQRAIVQSHDIWSDIMAKRRQGGGKKHVGLSIRARTLQDKALARKIRAGGVLRDIHDRAGRFGPANFRHNTDQPVRNSQRKHKLCGGAGNAGIFIRASKPDKRPLFGVDERMRAQLLPLFRRGGKHTEPKPGIQRADGVRKLLWERG